MNPIIWLFMVLAAAGVSPFVFKGCEFVSKDRLDNLEEISEELGRCKQDLKNRITLKQMELDHRDKKDKRAREIKKLKPQLKAHRKALKQCNREYSRRIDEIEKLKDGLAKCEVRCEMK